MAKMCDYANCDVETTAVTVNIKGNPAERLAYCCVEHASNALAARYERSLAMRRRASPDTNAETSNG